MQDRSYTGMLSKEAEGLQALNHSEIENKANIGDLNATARATLAQNGVSDLRPVQSAVYNLFLDGKELIVKSKSGTGKTLAFLLPLQELIRLQSEANPHTE